MEYALGHAFKELILITGFNIGVPSPPMDHHSAQQQQHSGMQPQMMSSSAESGLQLLGNLNNSPNATSGSGGGVSGSGNGNNMAGNDDTPFNPIKSLLQQLQQQQRHEQEQQVMIVLTYALENTCTKLHRFAYDTYYLMTKINTI